MIRRLCETMWLPETGSRRKLLNVRGAWAPAKDVYKPIAEQGGGQRIEERELGIPPPLCFKSSTRRRLALL
ncbi:hypothetical protein V6N12_076354 [Hibiscus sabdariffa]|uniref:Uncharacterized protein n=1 Tax=Hibiscus sabdariffa TaxID=183260 RepID=A0ABR2D9X7_9ROSI